MVDKQQTIDDLLKLAASWNGFEREDAVKQLGEMGNEIALPMLIERANDWVPQARTAAYQAISRLLLEKNAVAFINALPSIYHLRNCYRDDHRAIIEAVELFLVQSENQSKVIDGCTDLNPLVARYCFQLSVNCHLLTPYQLVLHSMSSRDIIVRSAVVTLFKRLTDDELKAVVVLGLRDPFMPVRREAFLLSLSRFPETSIDLLERFIFDRHAMVREIAIQKSLELGIDVQRLYLQVLSSKQSKLSCLRSALLGLSEISDASAINVISEYQSSEFSSLRKASLQALVRLDSNQAEHYLLIGLQDVSASLVRESARLLKRLKIRLSESELVNLYSINNSDLMMSCVLLLNGIRNKWDRITFLLWLANSPASVESVETVEIEIKKWINDYNKSFMTPTPSQLEAIHRQMHDLSNRRIVACLKPYLS